MLFESAVWTADLGAYEWDMRNDRVRWLNGWCKYYSINPCGLSVNDDGCGITAEARSGGLGLHIMRGRAELVGAQLKIEPGNGGGTLIYCHYTWRRSRGIQTSIQGRGGTPTI